MSVKNLFERYLLALRKTPIDEKTEHTDRAALQDLLQALAEQSSKGIAVQHEPKRAADKGAPDFKISKNGLIVGYVENKGIGENLDKVLKSDQIARYKSLSDNIILTDYLHFVWINKYGPPQRETLCHQTDLENPKFKLHENGVAPVVKLLQGFFSTAPEGIGRAEQLALALATRSQLLRDFLGEELDRQEREHKEGRLYGLFQVFRDQVFHELTLKEFADAFAQMLAYGLFLARLNSGAEMITLHNAREYVPGSFRLIRELVDFLIELEKAEYRDIRWVVEEVLSIVNTLDLAAIHEDLSFKNRKAISRKVKAKDEEEWRLFSRDPFVYFYEDYLAKYDAKMKKARGVYYTPPPIVNFIVRAIDDILKETFGIKVGLADHNRVTVLDFACGTGTFLVEVLERIFENIGEDSGKRDLIVRNHILKNIYGFEYLIAPYTIAHLKLSQFLEEQGHKLKNGERFPIYLTNTLEPIEPQKNYLLPALTDEVEAAQSVKEKPILVITGNPPYSGESKNKGNWITAAIGDYKFTMEAGAHGLQERKPVREKNLKWLQDDYVKFIRFAQMKMDAVDEGVVGIITNHSYLDNPTFPGMRQSLMRTFDQIWLIDLHGSTKPKEHPPGGIEDENVFDIMKGVAIALFIKKSDAEKGVWRADLWGKRLAKYQQTAALQKRELNWTKLRPESPNYLFVPEDRDVRSEYERGILVTNIFPVGGTGIITKRDDLCIHFEPEDVWKTVESFSRVVPQDALEKFGLPKDVRDWKVEWAQADLQSSGPVKTLVKPILYRPFDTRYTYYTGRARGFLGWPVERVMRHLLKDNFALITSRLTKGEDFAHVQVTDKPAEVICMSPETSNNGFIFPLYLYAPEEAQKPPKADLFGSDDPFHGKNKIENIAPKFRLWIDEYYAHHFSPEQLLGFIYAILHAPTYRKKFGDFLRRSFPRIPFPKTRANFESLSKLGWDLVQKHLLRDVPSLGLGKYCGHGDNEVEKIQYVAAEQAVYINATQHFAPVSPDVWDFRVGGYFVVSKYLKSRKGRKLTLDEIDNVTNVTNVLAFTIEQMRKIDEAYRNAFET